jgi:hypothetical protein
MPVGRAWRKGAAGRCRVKELEAAGWIWALVSIEPEALGDSTERINISLHRRVLRVIDRAAARARKTRSG